MTDAPLPKVRMGKQTHRRSPGSRITIPQSQRTKDKLVPKTSWWLVPMTREAFQAKCNSLPPINKSQTWQAGKPAMIPGSSS